MIFAAHLAFPAQAGIHFHHGHRPEFILGPAQGRTRGPVWRDIDVGIASRRRQFHLGWVGHRPARGVRNDL
jgi:hypothetical protein